MHTDNLDLNEILVFTRVVQAGSFTAAAAELGLPKSTVSRRVSELESRLGVRLLQRTTRKLGLTDAGRIFFRYAERMVQEAQQAVEAVHTLQVQPRGRLRVTAPLSFGMLSGAIARFVQRYPEVELELVCTDRMVDLVEEGFDVAIRTGRLLDSSLIARPLGEFRRVLVASREYVGTHVTISHPSELSAHSVVAFGVGATPSRWALRSSDEAMEVRVTARLIVNDLDLLIAALSEGLGVALIPEFALQTALGASRLVRVLEGWEGEAVPLHAVYPSARLLSPKVAAFIDVLTRELRTERGWRSERTVRAQART